MIDAPTMVIPYTYNKPIKIRPISCLHLGSRLVNMRSLKEYLESDDDTYYIGIGDIADFIVPSDTKRYFAPFDGISDQTNVTAEIRKKLFEIFNPIRDKVLGMGIGNHEFEFIKRHGSNAIEDLCEDLEVPYLGYSGFYHLKLVEDKKVKGTGHGRSRIIKVYYHHGFGGSTKTIGGNYTKYERHAGRFDADIYLYAHVHTRGCLEIPRCFTTSTGKIVSDRPKLLCICGTYKETYSDTKDPTFAERCGFGATRTGGVEIELLVRSDARGWTQRGYVI